MKKCLTFTMLFVFSWGTIHSGIQDGHSYKKSSKIPIDRSKDSRNMTLEDMKGFHENLKTWLSDGRYRTSEFASSPTQNARCTGSLPCG